MGNRLPSFKKYQTSLNLVTIKRQREILFRGYSKETSPHPPNQKFIFKIVTQILILSLHLFEKKDRPNIRMVGRAVLVASEFNSLKFQSR
jgi:hypothetical protein